jgi:hypothetical protein
MKVGVDLATVDNTLVKQDDGKYLYRLPNGKLDIDHWSRDISQYSAIRKNDVKILIDKKLEDLNKQKPVELVYDLSVGQIIINLKDTMFDVLDDVINMRFETETLTKNNRLFYIGIFLIILACVIFSFSFFGVDSDKKVSYESNIKIDS